MKTKTKQGSSAKPTPPQAQTPPEPPGGSDVIFEGQDEWDTQLFEAHRRSTFERMRTQPVLLIPHDITSMDCTLPSDSGGWEATEGQAEEPKELLCHGALALSEEGLPLGLCWARIWTAAPRKARRVRPSLESHPSDAWSKGWGALRAIAQDLPQTRVIALSDHAGDVSAILAQALQDAGPNLGLVVRWRTEQKLESPLARWFADLASQPVAGELELEVPRHLGHQARTTTLQVRFTSVSLPPSAPLGDGAPVSVWLVEAREAQPPAGMKPICWLLLSSLPVGSLAEAVRCVRCYACRWQMAEFNRLLKTGWNDEMRHVDILTGFDRLLLYYLVHAARVLTLLLTSRRHPDWPMEGWLTRSEWKVLSTQAGKDWGPLPPVPTLERAVNWIARMGGFFGRKGDGLPGATSLWIGLKTVQDMAMGWDMFDHES